MGVRGSYTCHYQSQHYPVICHALPQQLALVGSTATTNSVARETKISISIFNNEKRVLVEIHDGTDLLPIRFFIRQHPREIKSV